MNGVLWQVRHATLCDAGMKRAEQAQRVHVAAERAEDASDDVASDRRQDARNCGGVMYLPRNRRAALLVLRLQGCTPSLQLLLRQAERIAARLTKGDVKPGF